MSIKLSEFLQKKQNKLNFNNDDEFSFFHKNRHLIPNTPMFAIYRKARKPFEVIRANIIIRGLINKRTIEKEISVYKLLNKINAISLETLFDNIKKLAQDLPFFIDTDGNKIIIPFFSRNLNYVYQYRLDNLLRDPYKKLSKKYYEVCVDPFDYYGPSLYDSEFSKLIKITSNSNLYAYFDYDSQTIYFVDDQGRLENYISLFDKDLSVINQDNILNRIKPTVDAYFNSDKEKILQTLIDNKLISSNTIQEYVDSNAKEEYDSSEK